jgi:hypothetical protein
MRLHDPAELGQMRLVALTIEQQPAELVLYPKGHFKGGGYPIAGASQSMRVFTVRSVKIPEGQSWVLCSGNTFTGCTDFQLSD